MFDLVVGKTLYDSDSLEQTKRFVRFKRKLELPFVPFVGLTIGGGGLFLVELQSVHWDLTSKQFGCHDLPGFYNCDDFTNFEEWTNEEFKLGWETRSKILNMV